MSRVRHRFLVTLCAAGMLAAVVLSFGAPRAAAVGNDSLLSVVNGYRASAGLPVVATHAIVEQVAVERSATVAANRHLAHDFEALGLRLAQLGVCFDSFGEILLENPTLDFGTFGVMWSQSPSHNATMLGASFTHAGGGYTTGADGRHYVAVVFIDACDAIQFSDTASSPFLADIQWLVAAGITNGCGGGAFCPTAAVTREQMASFLKRALGLPPPTADYFSDDWSSGHQDDINRVAERGITNGCGGGLYCPGQVVTRDQMASFLVRALGLPATGHDYFWDDAGSPHEADINRLAAAGVTTGCGNGQYCPGSSVTREQMAAFLHRAFD